MAEEAEQLTEAARFADSGHIGEGVDFEGGAGGAGEDFSNDTYGFYVRQYNDDQDARGDEDLGEFDEHAADYGDHFAPTIANEFQDYVGGADGNGGPEDGFPWGEREVVVEFMALDAKVGVSFEADAEVEVTG